MRTWSLRVLRQSLRPALSALHVLAAAASTAFKSRAALHLENLALRHQFGPLQMALLDLAVAPGCVMWLRLGTRHWTATPLLLAGHDF